MTRVIVGLTLTAVLLVMLRLAFGSDCDQEVQQSLTSPDRRHTARIAIRSCGATVEFVTVVEVGRGESFTEALAISGRTILDLKWSDASDALLIGVGATPAEKVYPKAREIDGVRVEVR